MAERLRVAQPPERALVVFDGDCGFCRQWVARWKVRTGSKVDYAPSQEVAARFPETGIGGDVPDSLVLRTADGRVLFRSGAVLEILERLGGPWRTVGRAVGLLPRWLLDALYDGIARVRKYFFARPPGACPILPADLRTRFLP